MRFEFPIVFTDPDRAIQYEATAYGTAWHGTPARGPSYSSGGEPAEPAGCEVEKIEIESMVVEGKANGSDWGISAKPHTADDSYRGFCDEVLEDNLEAIEEAVGKALADEEEQREQDRYDAEMDKYRERDAG